MLMRPRRLPGLSLILATLLLVNPARAQFEHIDPTTDAFDSVMATYAWIDWDDPLNPRYINLDNDQFLLDTQRGIQLWDAPTNTFTQPIYSYTITGIKLKHLDSGTNNWARLGDSPAGTVLVSVGEGNASNTLLWWWDGKKRHFAAALPLDKALDVPSLLSLGAHHALLCSGSKGSNVVRLQQDGDKANLVLETSDNTEARAALRAAGVVGAVTGFGILTEADTDRPVFYDVSLCGWEIRNPPEAIKQFLDKKTRRQSPMIKPYFLVDGRIVLSEVSYFDGQYWRDMNPPLLWQPETHSWVAIEHTTGKGGQTHRVGQNEPVMSHGFQSEVVEFLDTQTMQWMRSQQRLPEGYGANIEPLSNGNALVLMRASNSGIAGLISPARASTPPPGRLGLDRHGYDGEIVLRDGGLMLVGNGDVWEPSVRSEIIDAARGQAKQIASLPDPLVSPYGLELKDGSMLVFGGLPPRCGPDFYFFTVEPCSRLPAQASFRYFPHDNRWQPVPDLKIPFTRGYWWETGNSGLASQWPRNDALVRKNGDVAWIEGGESFGSDEGRNLPQTSLLKRWRQADQSSAADTVARLRKARTQSTLLELADGRLTVMGGMAQLERVALEKECFDCPDEFVSIGPFQAARSTEILDESSANPAGWQAGPTAHYGGGRALKLANGRIFKLSLTGVFDSDGYRAEIADAAFTRWEKLPPFPLKPAIIRNVSTAGNRVLILTNTGQTVVWDDDTKAWHILKWWPTGGGSTISITALADGKRVLIRYGNSFEITPLPE